MADSPPRSRSVSPTPSWYPDATANGMSLWDTVTFKVHIGDSILQEMWNDRHNADFEIHCGTENFKVHKAVLRAHSDEALSGVLTLEAHPYKGNIDNLGDGDDPEIVGEMIHYFYHLELSPKANAFMPRESRDVHGEPSLIYLARIYVLAEKFFCEGLKAKVMSGFRESLEREITQNELTEACRIIFKKTVEPAGERGLKTTVAKCLADKLEKVKISESHDDLLQEISELAFLVLKEVPKPYDGRRRGKFCCNCGRIVQSW
ncbi:hypothetical protein D6C84_07885 [Aureobasidium pullulans]|uniref:BTB domain-containing protein n=1 Tax=Aureobasidium pullulans TaxID=5580 RepID=A0A4S9XIK0_AURPU|nr:hypothetical protein D6C84_07885 [Aureobasidium pullulans]